MKLLLIQPPVQDFYDTDVRLQPIGLCYLKAAVKKYLPSIEVVIKDYHAGCGRRTVIIPKELRYLSEFYPVADKSPFSTFHSPCLKVEQCSAYPFHSLRGRFEQLLLALSEGVKRESKQPADTLFLDAER